MLFGRNIPRSSVTRSYLKEADEIVKKVAVKTKALKAKKAKETADAQHARFRQIAREVEADERPGALDKALKKVLRR